ncbi:TerC family protein [soil metagenome]
MFQPVLLAATDVGDRFVSFEVAPWQWLAFVLFVGTLLMIDVLLVHRTAHVITFKEAAIESAVWISIGLSFTFVFLWWHGGAAAGEYLSGFLIEKSLSIDNVFVWAVIFSYFKVPQKYQFRTLFWGIFGALVLRAIFIFAGVALIEAFDWILYIFGAFLIYTAVKIARHQDAQVDPAKSLVLRAVRKVIPSTDEYDGQKLFTKKNGKRLATPLLAVLILIETTDVVFAVDSIPAILAVSREQFIVFSSNAFAILGLRALYFCLAGMADRFRYLNYGLGVVLAFVGVKMLIAELYHFPTWLSLAVIIVTITVTIVLSLRADRRDDDPTAPGPDPARPDLTGADTPGPAPVEEPSER